MNGRRIRQGRRRQKPSLLDSYIPAIGVLIERRSTELGLVAARLEAERAVEQAKQAMFDAEAADRAKTTFLANMSHELRTPLNAIMGFSEIIEIDDDRQRERHSQYAGFIHQSAEHLLAIVNEILDIARIESGRLELDERSEEIQTVLDAAALTIRPLADKKSIAVAVSCAPSTIILRADPIKIKQILINLLSNAVKFTKSGGAVTLDAALGGDGDLVIAVGDNGIGIAPEFQESVFEPFEQVEEHLARSGSGAGLGLPIARALARLHGGELSLTSRLGVGSKFELRLPRQRVHCLAAFAED